MEKWEKKFDDKFCDPDKNEYYDADTYNSIHSFIRQARVDAVKEAIVRLVPPLPFCASMRDELARGQHCPQFCYQEEWTKWQEKAKSILSEMEGVEK